MKMQTVQSLPKGKERPNLIVFAHFLKDCFQGIIQGKTHNNIHGNGNNSESTREII